MGMKPAVWNCYLNLEVSTPLSIYQGRKQACCQKSGILPKPFSHWVTLSPKHKWMCKVINTSHDRIFMSTLRRLFSSHSQALFEILVINPLLLLFFPMFQHLLKWEGTRLSCRSTWKPFHPTCPMETPWWIPSATLPARMPSTSSGTLSVGTCRGQGWSLASASLPYGTGAQTR